MRTVPSGYRVAVVGSSSLLGQELLAVLKESQFPVSRLVRIDDEEEAPSVPILDLSEYPEDDQAQAAEALARLSQPPEGVNAEELDFVFVAHLPRKTPEFLAPGSAASGCIVIDLTGALANNPEAKTEESIPAALMIPALERDLPGNSVPWGSTRFISPHPASIVLASLLLRIAARFPLRQAVGLVLNPASEIGAQAIEELQRQTMNLLSFQKIPHAVFGSQMAYNLLPRLGKSRRAAGPYRDELTDLDGRVRGQLRQYLGNRAPIPALRVIQAPVFYSLVASLYFESESPAAPEAVERALAGTQFKLRKLSEQAPSQVESAGASEILVDAISSDPDHPNGIWIWAAADNLRLAASNAVEIATVQAVAKRASRQTT